MSCFNVTGRPQTTAQAAEAKNKAIAAASERAARMADKSCLNCGILVTRRRARFCSRKCQEQWRHLEIY
jgi:hypothetical protein